MSLFVFFFLLLPVVALAVVVLLIRESAQHRGLLARLQPGAPRDVLRPAVAAVAGRVGNGPGTGGRPVHAADLMHWGALLMLAAAILLFQTALGTPDGVWLILEWLALPAVAWWLAMRRRGVRNAHRLPIIAWLTGYAVVLAALALRQVEHAAIDSPWLDGFLLGRWLGVDAATTVASIALVAAGIAAAVSLATIRGRASLLSDATLVGVALLVGAMVWSLSTLTGVLNVALTAGIVGYGMARANRIDDETRAYGRMLAGLPDASVGAVTLRSVEVASTAARADTALRVVWLAGAIAFGAYVMLLLPVFDAVPHLLSPLVAGLLATAVASRRASSDRLRSGDLSRFHAVRDGVIALLVAVFAYTIAHAVGTVVSAAVDSTTADPGNVFLAALGLIVGGMALAVAAWFAVRRRLTRWVGFLLAFVWIPVGTYGLSAPELLADGAPTEYLVGGWVYAVVMLGVLLTTMALPLLGVPASAGEVRSTVAAEPGQAAPAASAAAIATAAPTTAV